MKHIVIEISDKQHLEMMNHIQQGHKLNLDNATFSGYSINLNSCELGDWIEVDFNGVINLGDVVGK